MDGRNPFRTTQEALEWSGSMVSHSFLGGGTIPLAASPMWPRFLLHSR